MCDGGCTNEVGHKNATSDSRFNYQYNFTVTQNFEIIHLKVVCKLHNSLPFLQAKQSTQICLLFITDLIIQYLYSVQDKTTTRHYISPLSIPP